jgi:peroxin-11B
VRVLGCAVAPVLLTPRTVLQLGKPVEHLQAALRAYQTAGLASSGEQAMLVLRQLCYFGYLTYDALVWVRRVSPVLC